ncbi:hypothetical protein SERLADRAFT_383335 [Serpula lacrymans var. lacrymans S7.9]|nr:uncharacterized protein SERLADRAFT_383335 [Serpula lacrymans var. lacrymans S7.9]EGO27792.1 hypothetical protein SERLADRAFT_383335 [Serpula lacrymans var. lacrymans S7.9]
MQISRHSSYWTRYRRVPARTYVTEAAVAEIMLEKGASSLVRQPQALSAYWAIRREDVNISEALKVGGNDHILDNRSGRERRASL